MDPGYDESVPSTSGIDSIYCCNPFQKINHKKLGNSVRPVLPWMSLVLPVIKPGMKICDSCRKALPKANEPGNSEDNEFIMENVGQENDDQYPYSQFDESFVDKDTAITYLSKSLECLSESPIAKKRLTDPRYYKPKFNKIKQTVSEKMFNMEIDEKSDDSEVIRQLKEKFQITKNKNEKVLILTILPRSWSVERIEKEFNVSKRMARKSKELVKKNGILTSPDPKPGKSLNQSTVEKVKLFYNSDDVSRLMPGKKDYVSIRTSGSREHVQKRLILGNLKEIYKLFKSSYPEEKIGFSKFADLRPKNCILAGASGTHTVCVCIIHENVKLMLQNNIFKDIILKDGSTAKHYNDCLAEIMCAPSTPDCHLNTCKECPGTELLKELLYSHFDEEMIDNITYKQWTTVDRCSFETVTKSVDDFVDSFSEKLILLKRHAFIAKQQSAYLVELKKIMNVNEAVFILDFAENYSFVIQDEVQSHHWNNEQATVHPFAVYYNDGDSIKYQSFVVISDCLKHNTVAVHLFKKNIINYIKENLLPTLKKIYYFSDGAAAQYKNRKNFSNICHHKNDFNIDAEWHFFATSHGKGVCDGLGGTVKRLATKASLQNPGNNLISTPSNFYDWCVQNIPSIKFLFTTKIEHEEEEKLLLERFSNSSTIESTLKYHCFIPIDNKSIRTKIYSGDSNFKEHKFMK